MKERTNRERLELFADLIDPAAEIVTDPEVRELLASGSAPMKAVQLAIKNHGDAVVAVLAILEETRPEEYRVPPPGEMLLKLLGLLGKPEVTSLFTLQLQRSGAASSGAATENTEGGAS